MVIFNDLRIDESDKRKLIVDLAIEDADAYENFYIDSIYLDYYKNNAVVQDHSDDAIPLYINGWFLDNRHYVLTSDNSVQDLIEHATEEGEWDPETQDFGTDTLDKGIFYVIVNVTDGTDSYTEIGVVIDWQYLYNQGMSYIELLSSRVDILCNMPAGFEQFIIIWNAIRLALATSDYTQVAALWDKLLRITNAEGNASFSGGCGCNG